MDLFKFNPVSGAPTIFERGSLIQNIKSVMWVERYLEAGEFEIVARVDSNLRSLLPIGSFISHTDTTEVMIVENHEISDNNSSDPEIKITGRSFEVILETRVVGSNQIWTSPPGTGQVKTLYTILPEAIWAQALSLIYYHIKATPLIDDNDVLLNVGFGFENVTLVNIYSEEILRPVERGNLYERVLEILTLGDFGIKTVRPGIWSPLTSGGLTDVGIIVHQGLDLTKNITFSYPQGEIVNAQYLWSNKRKKTSALVSGKWVETMIHGPEINYDRRVMLVDGSAIDEGFSDVPTGTDLTDAITRMQTLGRQALSAKKDVAMVKAEVSKNSTRYIYRKDYNIGDFVSVEGNYDESSVMRVVEHVEIYDETGESSYPTLSSISIPGE